MPQGGRDPYYGPDIWDDQDMEELAPLGKEEDVKPDAIFSKLRKYLEIYIDQYRERVEVMDLEPEYMPDFYDDHPFNITLYLLPNGATCAAFEKEASALRFRTKKADYEAIRRRLMARDLSYFFGFLPYHKLTEEAAIAKARKEAERDIRAIQRTQNLRAMNDHIAELEKEIEDVAKMNPWLEDHAASSSEHLTETQTLLESMQTEVERQEEERFARFEDELERLEAFEAPAPPPPPKRKAPPKPATKKMMKPARPQPKPRPMPPKKRINQAFVQVKTQKVIPPPPPKKEPPKKVEPPKPEVPEELKNTVFRMNRRVYSLERKVTPMERYVKDNVFQMQKAMKTLQKKQVRVIERHEAQIAQQQAQISAMEEKVDRAYNKGRSGITIGTIALLMALGALFFFFIGLDIFGL